jgi:hypothetical protein
MREDLGNDDAEKAGLTLHELGELIRRAGRKAGFTVRNEYPVGKGKRNSWRIDWVWQIGSKPVIAFEIEGRNVPESSLAGDRRKFQELPPSCAKVVALYTVRGEQSLALPRKRMVPAKWFEEMWQPRDEHDSVHVTLDTELLAPGGIEELQDLAMRRAAL